MNSNHAGQGRFCSRSDARTITPLSSECLEDFEAEILRQIQKTISSHSDIIEDGGKGLVLLYPTGCVELIVLSQEGYEAYAGNASEGERLPKRRGKVGGIQDGHNIRRGLRRWLERNADIIGDKGVCLCAVRDDDDVLRLSAVVMAR